jgi:hypothetical protein
MVTLDATNVTDETELDETGEMQAGPADDGPQDLEEQFDQAMAERDEQDQTDGDVSDAGELAETAEETETQPAGEPVREITLEIPKRAKTTVVLLVQLGPTGRWHSGFRTTRNYNPQNGTELNTEELPNTDPMHDEGAPSIGEAVVDAAEWVEAWIRNSAGEDDKRAEEAADAVIKFVEELSEDLGSVTESIFDNIVTDSTDAAANGEPDPATNDTPADQTAVIVEIKGDCPPPADVEKKRFGVTDESQAHFDARKRDLEQRVSGLAVEMAKLKGRQKTVNELLKGYTQELADLLHQGPEILPLFDQQPKPAEVVTDATDADGLAQDQKTDQATTPESVEPDQQAIAEPVGQQQQPEAWREVKLSDLDGLTPKILEVLDVHHIRTMGDLADAPMKKNCELTQLDGITEKRFERIQAATDAYWKKHPQSAA